MPLIDLNLAPQRSHLRTFGLACAVFAAAFAAWRWGGWPVFSKVLAAIAALAALLALAAPRLLRWPFILASLITWPIGQVLSWVLLALVYYAVFTPIGLIRRRFGGLDLHPDPASPTYWRPRPPAPPPATYFRQH